MKRVFDADMPSIEKIVARTLDIEQQRTLEQIKTLSRAFKTHLWNQKPEDLAQMTKSTFSNWTSSLDTSARLLAQLRPAILAAAAASPALATAAAAAALTPKDISTTPVQTARFDGGLFTRMLDGYNRAPNKRAAGERIVDMMDTTPVLSRAAIAITFVDRLVFFAIAALIRNAVLALVAWLVAKGAVKSLRVALVAFGAAYTALVLLLFAAVYLSDSTLRIAINYINPHANSTHLVVHLFIVWMVLLVGIVVLFADGGAAAAPAAAARLSAADKADVMGNLTSITFFMWIILSLQILFT